MIPTLILIVEDESHIASNLEHLLENIGYQTALVNSGEEAIQYLEETIPDLVLMDICLPGLLDGIQTVETIRERFSVPVVYLTAYADAETIERAKVTEPYGYLIKPFDVRELASVIRIALHKYMNDRALQSQQQWLTTTLKSIGDGVITTDQKGTVTFINPIAEKLTGWTQQEAVGKPITQIFRVCERHSKKVIPNVVKLVLNQQKTVEFSHSKSNYEREQNSKNQSLPERFLLQHPDHHLIPIDASASPLKNDQGELLGVVLIIRDITERQKYQYKLQELNAELEKKVKERTLELEETIQHLEAEIEQRQKTEVALRQSEERFRNLIETLSDWVWETNNQGICVYASPKLTDVLGYRPHEVVGKHLYSFMTATEAERVTEVVAPLWENRAPFHCIEYTAQHKEGYPVVLETSGVPLFNAKGEFQGYRGIDRDITERKQAQEALESSFATNRALLNTMPDPMVRLSRHGSFLNFKEGEGNGFLLPVWKCLGKTVRDALPPKIAEEFMSCIEQALTEETCPVLEYQLVRGEVVSHWEARFSVSMKQEEVMVILRDISERKQFEESLKSTNEQLRATTSRLSTLIENLQFGVLVKDESQRVVLTNQAFCDLFNIDIHPVTLIGASFADFPYSYQHLFVDGERFLEHHKNILAEGHVMSDEEIQLVDGRTFARDYVPIVVEGQEQGHLWMFRDITERKQQEQVLRASLQEKEVLLKEIHHRVKNNLQIVSSLLKLQSAYIEDEQAVMMFTDCYNRVRSMALIHEKLYRTEDLAHINAPDYITSLVHNLMSTYNSMNRVQMQVNVAEIYLDIDTAIPCGLIITELVSNAMKHAFPPPAQGIISIEFGQEGGELLLVVRDNGVGLPGHLDIEETESLGLQLVVNLTAQLEGELTVQGEGGTCFAIAFPQLEP
ncbi:PAS domain S-box protein [Spirulina subsalsa]|uniref:PAS domain S-box protein n=1 Tax=Spirulina subsalsa TaxID=54311 RepID=UPI0002F7F11E|nr:PAS domain S-box protein [Spirulina subsalsa]